MRTTKVALFVVLVSFVSPRVQAEEPEGPPPPPPLTLADAEAKPASEGLVVPKFSKGGVTFSLEFGPAAWAVDSANLASQLASQTGAAGATFLGDAWARGLKTSYCLALRFGYNILGFATVEFAFTGSGWALDQPTRGGGGYAGAVVRFHPLEILWRVLKKDPRPFGLDFSTYWGWGWGIAGFGENLAEGLPALGMDGFVFQWGFDVEYFFTKAIGVSLGLRGGFPFWNKLYINYEQKVGYDVPGGIRAAMWTPAIGIVMRSGD